MGTIKINDMVYGSNNASEIIYKSQTVEEKLDTIPIFDINDNGNVDNDNSDVLTYGHIIDSLNSDAVNKVLSAKQGKVLKNYIDNIDFSPLENSISSLESELEESINSLDISINNLDAKITEFQNTFLNLVYPIGAIYLSLSNTNPGTLFGGTWEAINDRFLLSAGSSYSAGSTGGAATHKLTTSEMPSHTHEARILFNQTGYGNTSKAWELFLNEYVSATATPMASTAGTAGTLTDVNTRNLRNVTNAGGGAAHNNMPPYLTVYMWKRVS